jgi:hypothetical protein
MRKLPSVVLLMIAIACSPGPMTYPGSAAPMNKPVPLGSDAASGAVETARRQLFGTWDLVALEAAPSSGGPRMPIEASGTLVYDEFGNLTIDAHTTDPDAPVAAREVELLSFQGRAVLDVPRSELKLTAMTGNVNPDEVLTLDRRRRYEFAGDLLKLSSFDEQGTVTAISTWRRRP